MPENTKLETNRRWNSTNISSSGAATRNVPAAMTPHSEPASAPEVNDASPTVSTWLRGEDSAINGHRNSFQCVVTETMAKAVSPGRAKGSSTRVMIVSGTAPSTSAASSYSRGMVRNVWRIRNTPNAEAKYGAITPGSVSYRCSATRVVM